MSDEKKKPRFVHWRWRNIEDLEKTMKEVCAVHTANWKYEKEMEK